MTLVNYYNYEDIRMLNFELTSKCALKCSRCARVTDPGSFVQVDLPLDLIKKRIPTSIFNSHLLIDLSGNYGDPIYHRDFIEVIKYFKSFETSLYIETNGSGRSRQWWDEVVSHLGPKDIISFSIDGLEDTNHIYRENARWGDIENAVAACAGKVRTFWKFIVFKYNQHQIEEAQALAQKWGINKFKLVKSSLFYYGYGEEDDPLMPDLEYVQGSLAKKIEGIRNPVPLKAKSNQDEAHHTLEKENQFQIHPKCITTQRHYISSEGFYTPCCWISIFSKDNGFNIQKKKEFSLYHHDLKSIIEGPAMKELAASWDQMDSAPKFCQKRCSEKVVGHSSHDFIKLAPKG